MLDSTLHEPNTGPPAELINWWGNADLHNWNRVLLSDKIVGDLGPSMGCPNPGASVPICASYVQVIVLSDGY